MHRFISDFAKNVKPPQEMIRKDENYKWNKERKEAFANIKEEIVEAPTLQRLDFDKEFILYRFSSNHSIAAILTQKDEAGDYLLISFMIMELQGAKLNYRAIYKQGFVVLKSVKHL